MKKELRLVKAEFLGLSPSFWNTLHRLDADLKRLADLVLEEERADIRSDQAITCLANENRVSLIWELVSETPSEQLKRITT